MKSKNFQGDKFVNPIPTTISKPGTLSSTLWKWISGDEDRQPRFKIEPFKTDADQLNSLPASGLRVTWISHSTVLIEIDGKRFLTDPMWSKRASPFSFAGPSRFFDPPLALDKLPKIDGVIISHDHYDHLDEATIIKLGKQGINFYMPLGVGEYLEEWGIPAGQIHELDWSDSIMVGENHKLTATPACHFSGRSLFGRDKTLWASWVIAGAKHKVYFGGDSGYFPGYKDIGEKYGPFDLTILEIGAYHPNWGAIHLGPVNAVKAHIDLQGKILLPVHWGTFTLALHEWAAPVEELIAEANSKHIALMLPRPGQPLSVPNLAFNSEWWKPRGMAKSNEPEINPSKLDLIKEN
ncbi:MAG: MBL fold metallo-hydrolase [Deltaproteobacteria bacterium HGW-Deltaproteobacteria-6]|nr:MAG: MBL fold metallo-hydrolase [Deltaproteobacteria bacterium HGW-Deltaproteobacteria-6]